MTTQNSKKLGFKPDNHWQAKAIMRNRAGQAQPTRYIKRKLPYQIADDLLAYYGDKPDLLEQEITLIKEALAKGFVVLKTPAIQRSNLLCTVDRLSTAVNELMATVPR